MNELIHNEDIACVGTLAKATIYFYKQYFKSIPACILTLQKINNSLSSLIHIHL